MTELDPEDLGWAVDFGARWGATFPALASSNAEISRSLTETANSAVNERIARRLWRLHGVPAGSDLTDAQAAGTGPYFLALMETIAREAQWALWWRNDQLHRGAGDPGVEYLERRADPTVLAYLATYAPKIAGNVQVTTNDGITLSNSPKPATFRERRQQRQQDRRRAIEHERLWAQQEHERLGRLEAEREHRRQLRPPAPAPQPYGVNHEGAERFVADWMRHLGVRDARVTQFSGDGGIDVDSRYVVAQVKNLRTGSAVPIAQIRDLFGTATHRGKGAALFTSGGISQGGLEFSNQTGMAVIQYNAERGILAGLNERGRSAITWGFPSAFGFDE